MLNYIINQLDSTFILKIRLFLIITALCIFFTGCELDSTPQVNEAFMSEMEAARINMMEGMNNAPITMDPDVDFANMMIPHHQGSVDMVNILFKYGKHDEALEIGRGVLEADQASIDRLEQFLESHGEPEPQAEMDFMNEMNMVMMKMGEVMKAMHYTSDPDYDFAEMMIHHHQGAIDMSRVLLKYGLTDTVRQEAQMIIDHQEEEIIELARFRNEHGRPD
jgi:uncharacterized protein (DUF305 family)